jgi:23S rRNA (cytosine1962-C5)-methyltransferase
MLEASFIRPILDRWDERLVREVPGAPFDSCRVFHGRGGCYEGLEWCCVDIHWPVVIVTLFREPPLEFVQELKESLLSRMQALGLSALVVQHRHQSGAPFVVEWGTPPAALYARLGELKFHLSLQQQNIGFFLDMEPGRQWLSAHCHGRRVLNLFAYTCALSVVAQAGGAESVVNVDVSSRSLSVGRENHRFNRHGTGNIHFMAENILKSWSRIRRRGPFDLLLIDPPSFQKGSFVAARDYAKVLRRIPQLATPGALILACLNAPELDQAFLQQVMAEACPDCLFVERLPAHPDFPDIDPARQLKLLVFSYQPQAGI